jgi:hypothetical protein
MTMQVNSTTSYRSAGLTMENAAKLSMAFAVIPRMSPAVQIEAD